MSKIKKCKNCSKEFKPSHSRQVYCKNLCRDKYTQSDEWKEHKRKVKREYNKVYLKTEKARESIRKAQLKYDKSEKGKESTKRFYTKNKDKIEFKIRQKKMYEKWKTSKKGEAYFASEEFKNFQRIYREKNKDNIKINFKKWYHSKKGQELSKQYRQSEKYKKREIEYRKEYNQTIRAKELRKQYRLKYMSKTKNRILLNDYRKKRYATNLKFYLTHTLRTQLNKIMTRKSVSKNNKALDLLGIEVEYFKKYLESKFKPGMSWSNRGTIWHLDHIIPLSIIDLSKDDNMKFAFHYRNLQPMFASENIRKSNKVFIKWEKHMKIRDMDPLVKNILKKCHPEQEFDLNLINEPNRKGIELSFKHTIN